VGPLADAFARQAGLPTLPGPVLEELKGRAWAGNARELRNAVQAFAAVGQLPPAVPARPPSLDEALEAAVDPTIPYAEQKETLIDRFTERYLRALLAYANGSQGAAARVAKLDRTHLGRLLAKYGMNARRAR
jgi:DNA-binding NtrC family response regulator